LTTICVNGQSVDGTCTSGTVNGPDIVECSTIESSGGSDPGTGLACTITYQIVGKIPSTPISFPSAPGCATSSVSSPPNVCVLVADNVGTAIPENTQGAFVTQSPFPDATLPSLICIPNPVVVGYPTMCTVTIADTNATAPSAPTGPVIWTTDGPGVFNPNSCTASAIGASTSICSVLYLPLGVGAGIHRISCVYLGLGGVYKGGTCPVFNLSVLPATPSIFTTVIVDQTGLPVNSTTGVPFGLTVHDTVIFLGGYPVTGATGSVTYTLYPNGACTTGTGTVVSTVSVAPADNVPNSASVMPGIGTHSFDATYTPDVNNNNAVRSTCEQFTVGQTLQLTAQKLHWTHHLSLSKSGNTQSWTVTMDNPLSTSAKVLIRIVGQSTTNPLDTFDVTCGVTCVNTDAGGVNSTPGLTPVSVPAGTSSFSFSFNQAISSSFANEKFTFTATLWWTTGTLYTHSDSKSGAFAIVP